MQTTKSKDGTTLAYDIYGNGPALIYITGASCFRSFGPIVQDAKVFSNEFTVYNYDRRGRGDSGNTLPYSVEKEVEDIEAMIDAAGGKAYLYGHSSGAVLALEAALKLKSKINKVVIYDPSYVHSEAEKISYGKLSKEVIKLIKEGKNAKAMKHFLVGIGMPKIFVFLLPLFPGWRKMVALAPTLEYDINLTKDLPPLERVSEIKVPVRIVVGEKSPEGVQEVGELLEKVIPGATIVKILGQDHMVNAKVLLPVLSNFLKD